MRFHFPVIIIDEDFRSENASGLGIRALADAIEKEGMEVLGVTSYGDLTSFAQQQSRASAFILSIDDEELALEPEETLEELRAFVGEIRHKNAEIPIFLHGETRTSPPHPERHPARAARLHPHARGHAGVHCPQHQARGQGLPRIAAAALLPRPDPLCRRRFVFLALPRPLRRRRLPEEPGRPDVPPVLWREHAACRRLQCRRGTRPTARPHRPGCRLRAQRSAHLQLRPPAISSPTAPRLRTRSSGTPPWRRATSSSSTATATSRCSTRSS